MSKGARILNISPKVQLNINDCETGAYPSILRTGDQRTLGNDPSIYNDSGIQIFENRKVLMPFNISDVQAKESGFLTGTIKLEKPVTPASQYLTKFEENYITPFNESRNPSAFFETGSIAYDGFPSEYYPGFDTPTRNQVAIEIDITPYAAQTLLRASNDLPGVTNNYSGFCYYNFEAKIWDYVGLKDPASGVTLSHTEAFKDDGTGGPVISGGDVILRQFTHSPGLGSMPGYTENSLFRLGYDKIGYPTAVYGAPNSPRYHATSSQCLKLSDYIQHPFILDRIEAHFSIAGIRRHGDLFSRDSIDYAEGFGRDIDNHAFFIYRQNHANNARDSIYDVSSSYRALITNESFCFYNAPSLPPKFSPIHPNQGEFSFSMDKTDVNQTITSGIKNITLHMRPRLYERQYTNASTVNRENKGQMQSQWFLNFWTGDNKNIKRETSYFNFISTSPPDAEIWYYPEANLVTSVARINYTNFIFDPRTLRSSLRLSNNRRGRLNNSFFQIPPPLTGYKQVTDTDLGFIETPYVLLPTDELIFGLDLGTFSTLRNPATPVELYRERPPGSGDTVISSVGSGLGIYGDKRKSKVILYGTLVKNGSEKKSELNQNLTSESVHEDVHDIITDTFVTSERLSYSGSYIDLYMTGTMGSVADPRRVKYTATSGLAGSDFALERFVTEENFSFLSANSILDFNSYLAIVKSKLAPEKPVSRFRYDRYGQFRDMLEQRIDTKGVETNYTSRIFPIPDFVRSFGTSLTTGPVIVTFTSQSSEIIVDPESTRSCNLSTECTSSLPYYDGEARNRSLIVFTENPPFTPTTVVLNKPSSLLSTTN